MNNRFQYRLSERKKEEIAKNLIDFLQKDSKIEDQTVSFIYKWCTTGHEGKRKAFFDVWDIVLKNYLPTTRPILFRSCERIGKNGKIASFTGSFECARRFSKEEGYLIICDTKEALGCDEHYRQPGDYKNTFYPLVSVLKKARELGECGFSDRFLNDYIGEDEYIMRIDMIHAHGFKWLKKLE
jgi:hypothetical protein